MAILFDADRRRLPCFTLPVAQYPERHAADGAGEHHALSRRQRDHDRDRTPSRCRSSRQVNGVDRMIYMQSYQQLADGVYALTVTFQIGTDLNFAQVLVQNRVSTALASTAAIGAGAGRAPCRRGPPRSCRSSR